MVPTSFCSRSWTRYPSSCVIARVLNWVVLLLFIFYLFLKEEVPSHEPGGPFWTSTRLGIPSAYFCLWSQVMYLN